MCARQRINAIAEGVKGFAKPGTMKEKMERARAAALDAGGGEEIDEIMDSIYGLVSYPVAAVSESGTVYKVTEISYWFKGKRDITRLRTDGPELDRSKALELILFCAQERAFTIDYHGRMEGCSEPPLGWQYRIAKVFIQGEEQWSE